MEIKPVSTPALISGASMSNTAQSPAAPSLPPQNSAAVSEPVTANKRPEPTASIEQLNRALEDINKAMRSLDADLEFTMDAETGRSIIRVTDKQTGELLRQMPSKEALEIAKALDKVEGVLIRHKV